MPSRTFWISLLAASVYAKPTPHQPLVARGILDDVLLFDGPAYPDPLNPANTLAQVQTYVSLRTPGDFDVVIKAFADFLESEFDLDVGDDLSILTSRLDIMASIGLPAREVEITVEGCSNEDIALPRTDFVDLGLASGTVSLGECAKESFGEGGGELQASVEFGLFDNREVGASVFFSPNSGFGVISGKVHLTVSVLPLIVEPPTYLHMPNSRY